MDIIGASDMDFPQRSESEGGESDSHPDTHTLSSASCQAFPQTKPLYNPLYNLEYTVHSLQPKLAAEIFKLKHPDAQSL